MARKTIEVETLRNKANRMLVAVKENDLPNRRDRQVVICNFIEFVLMDTDNYRGFKWITEANVSHDDFDSDHEDYFSRHYL